MCMRIPSIWNEYDSYVVKRSLANLIVVNYVLWAQYAEGDYN